jgi:hypothetical protein
MSFGRTENITDKQKQIIGSLFEVICIAGAAAGVSLNRCSKFFHYQKSQGGDFLAAAGTEANGATAFRGHHPNCGVFSSHVFNLGNRNYCAGCAGLVTGAVMAMIVSALYFFGGLNVERISVFLFWSGFAGVALGLLQYNIAVNRASIHFFINAGLVLGASFLLIGIDGINGSFVLELYVLALILYWILTRIILSQNEHKKTCGRCISRSCQFYSG